MKKKTVWIIYFIGLGFAVPGLLIGNRILASIGIIITTVAVMNSMQYYKGEKIKCVG